MVGKAASFGARDRDVRTGSNQFRLDKKTILLSELKNCFAIKAAVSEQSGESLFLMDRASGAAGALETVSQPNNSHRLHYSYRMTETIKCNVVAIDELIAQGRRPPDLIKIDVEKAEHLVLNGAKKCLEQHRSTLIVETVNDSLIAQLRSQGYRALRIDDGNILFVSDQNNMAISELLIAFEEIK